MSGIETGEFETILDDMTLNGFSVPRSAKRRAREMDAANLVVANKLATAVSGLKQLRDHIFTGRELQTLHKEACGLLYALGHGGEN